MQTISRVITSYSSECIEIYKDNNNVASATHMFRLLDIHGNRISRIYLDFEYMEMDMQVDNEPTITYKL